MKVPAKWQDTLIVFFFSSLIAGMMLYAVFFPPLRAQFFLFAVLNSQGNIAPNHYFPSGNDTVKALENVTWTLQVQNHMSEIKYLEWRVKLLNSTQQGVDTGACLPSPVHGFFSTRQLISPGEIWNSLVTWRITSGGSSGSSSVINRVVFNETIYSAALRSTNPGGFRLLFELWYFNPMISAWSFDFHQDYNGSPRTDCWWTLISFTLV